jgi:L-lactate dehydrogenase complex protein LldG
MEVGDKSKMINRNRRFVPLKTYQFPTYLLQFPTSILYPSTIHMNSREKILQAIREAKPDLHPLPAQIGFESNHTKLAEQFTLVLQSIGGKVVAVRSMADITAYLEQHYDLTQPTISLVEGLPPCNVSPASTDDPHQFENLSLVLLRAQIGVAENGAIWVDEQNFTLRVLPFITLNLAVVIDEDDLVDTMHEAYRQLPFATGYGVFIAGPSKTADIEQSLVIGAHGPKAMTVFLVSPPVAERQ